MKIKAILFDYWDTLAICNVNEKTLSKENKTTYNYLKSKGYKITLKEYIKMRERYFEYDLWGPQRNIEITPKEVFRKFIFKDINITDEDILKVIEINEKYDHTSKLRVDCKETLITLKKKGYKLGIITNAWLRFCKRELKEWGLKDLFDEIVISCDVGIRKPNKKIFNFTANKLGVSLSECVFVGDNHLHDIEGATKAGINYTIGIEPFKKNKSLSEPIIIVKNLKDILEVLDKINN